MKINSQQAKNIIRSLNDLIYDDIYVYDDSGDLLATNQNEVDYEMLDFGKIVAKTQTILVKDLINQNLKAILFPVNMGNKLIAIVGLVGEYAGISQYSGLVVKIVEILLSESIYYQRKIRNAENNRRYINELIFEDGTFESISLIGNNIDKKVDEHTYIALIDVDEEDMAKITTDLVIGSIEKQLSSKHIVGELEGNIIIIFSLSDLEEVKANLIIISDYLEKKYRRNVSIGISNHINHYKESKMAYYQSKKSLIIGKKNEKKGIFSFNDFSLEILFYEVSPELAESFLSKVLGGLKEEEITGIDKLLNIYIANNTSLTATSKKLFIHKNTLQYRLNKIQEMTGYNPRNTLELYKLFTAINLYHK